MHVDHIDGNGLNNIRDNIRECTAKQNLANQRKYKKSSSVFKGVHKIKKSGMWRALILYGGKRVSLGCYALETDAAHAYDAAALKYFGKFARINTYEADNES